MTIFNNTMHLQAGGKTTLPVNKDKHIKHLNDGKETCVNLSLGLQEKP